MAMQGGHAACQIPALKPRYVPGIPGPKGPGIQTAGALIIQFNRVNFKLLSSEL